MKKISFFILFSFCCFSAFSAEIVKSSAELEKKADSLYPAKDNVLYFLDSGMLNFYEGNYSAAVEKLSEAEKYIDDYYTKSISQNTAAFFTNDNVIEYPGEDYEDIYLNLFKAISYYKAGQWQEGFHEVNAYKRKAGAVAQRHSAELLKARQAAKMGESKTEDIAFHDSALGEYLFMLYYRSIRDENQVQYSARMLKDVFNTSGSIYNFSIPSSIDEEAAVKSNEARLNFVIFSGQSPKKIERTEYYSNELSLSLPELYIPSSDVNFISVKAINKATGKAYSKNLEQIENYGNICADVYKNRSKLIYYKSVARAIGKGSVTAGSRVAGDVLSDSDSAVLAALGGVLSAGSVYTENKNYETEHADLRHSNYFPGRADVGGITVEPGVYDITVSYFNRRGGNEVYKEEVKNVKVENSRLNLVSASSSQKETVKHKNDVLPQLNNTSKTVSIYDTVEKDKIFFDIGTEPEDSSFSTYGLFQYNWNNTYSSNFKIKYTSTTETEDEIEGFENATQVTKNKEFEFDLLPYIYNFGNEKNFSFSLGGSYQYIHEDSFAGMFDINGYMLDVDMDKGKYFTIDSLRTGHIIAPRIGVTAKFPLHKWFCVNFQAYANPIYYLILDQSVKYHSDQTKREFNYGGNDSLSKWSSPYIEAKLSADCFGFVRLVTQTTYQKLEGQQMDWIETMDGLVGFDDTQEVLKIRAGVELLAGSKKRARVRGGIYYQTEKYDSSYFDSTTRKNKFIISIGSER
ncbi:MAG: hypothetical protein KBT11_00130 [Treponema sp.]|nr:hypothetical protein [Candidatus Treponema equifaecale]